MDAKGEFISETATRTQKHYQFIKKTLQFLVPLSVFSFFFSYFSGFSFFASYDSQFSTLMFPPFANALERKYMFLICNGILMFLSKNLKCSSSCSIFYSNGGFVKSTGEGVKLISELPQPIEAEVQESESRVKKYDTLWNVSVEEGKQKTQQQQEQDYDQSFTQKADEMKSGALILQSEERKEEDDEAEESQSLEDEANYASVSTAELNKKFEEFIRKMKEEFRIEARQQLIAV